MYCIYPFYWFICYCGGVGVCIYFLKCVHQQQPHHHIKNMNKKLKTMNDENGFQTVLFVIDPQNDFIDNDGSLFVLGAIEDCKKVFGDLRTIEFFDGVIVTLDTHQHEHIAHQTFWIDTRIQDHPPPYVTITLLDAVIGNYIAADFGNQLWALEYIRRSKMNLTIWPQHCIKGTVGHQVYSIVKDWIEKWEANTGCSCVYIEKGENKYTESFSAIKAEVAIFNDPTTFCNTELVNKLLDYQRIVICGQALSHCVNFTVRDLVEANVKNREIIVLLDGSSTVPGYENESKKFVQDMKNLGVKFMFTYEFFQE